jgi:hypothetical protein
MDSGKKSPSLPFPPEKEASIYITSIVVGLLISLTAEEEESSLLRTTLLRTANLLYSWPIGMGAVVLKVDIGYGFDMHVGDVTVPSECGITYPDGVSKDLCGEVQTS